MDLTKKVIVWMMLFIGLATCLLGLVIGVVEIYHVFHGTHPFGYPPFIASALFIIGGASLVQTGSVKDSLNNLLSIAKRREVAELKKTAELEAAKSEEK